MSSGDGTRLGKELAKLEKEDPAVGEAARRLDKTVTSIVYRAKANIPKTRFHKSTPDTPCTPYS
jgi:hypothetical protein